MLHLSFGVKQIFLYLHTEDSFVKTKKRIMEKHITREAALELLKKYNKDSFHIHHALTVEGVMRWYAKVAEESALNA